MKKRKSGFGNDAADKIWQDHLGNNAFVTHRDQCPTCLSSYRARCAGMPWWSESAKRCDEGDKILGQVIDAVDAEIDEVHRNHN